MENNNKTENSKDKSSSTASVGYTANAITNLQKYEPKEGYWVAFSGGKDSIVAYDLVKRSKVKFDVHHSITTIDPPEVMKFIKKVYPEVKKDKPELSMFDLVVKKGLPTRLSRFCCEYLKESGGNGRIIVDGVRADESNKRKDRKLYEKDSRKKMNKTYLHIIVNWSEKDVWNYIHENNLEYPSVYDNGLKRVGCVGCPLAYYKQVLREFEMYPHIKKGYIKAIKVGIAKGKYKRFTKANLNENDIFDWWVTQKPIRNFIESKKQCELFEAV